MRKETSMSEENRALALRTSEIVNQKNPDLIEEFYPPDFVWHGPAGYIRGYEQAKQMSSMFFAAFPDAQMTDEDVIAEGEKALHHTWHPPRRDGGVWPSHWQTDRA